MDWFDAVCHGFSALALGGFSTYDASIGHFNSLPIEMVLTVFQVLAALEFRDALSRLEPARRHGLLSGRRGEGHPRRAGGRAASAIALFLFIKGTYPDFPTALRHATFNLVSIATDSGLHTQDYSRWPIFAPMWMMFLSCIVASSGSTGGGIKMIRTLVLAKQAHRELNQLVHPNMVRPLKVGGIVIANRVVFAVLAFVFLYFMSIVTLVFVQLASGLDFMTSFSSIIACINNAGPGLGLVGPGSNYGVLERFPDLGVLGGHAARPTGGFHHFGAVHSHFMAKIAGPSHPFPGESLPCEDEQQRGKQVKTRAGQDGVAQRLCAEPRPRCKSDTTPINVVPSPMPMRLLMNKNSAEAVARMLPGTRCWTAASTGPSHTSPRQSAPAAPRS